MTTPDEHAPATTERLPPVSARYFGPPGQIRNAGLVFLLGWITFGLYDFYVHFKMNKEMKEFASAVNVSPGLSTFLLVIPVVSLVTVIRTTGRVNKTRATIGLPADASGFVTFLCVLVGASWAYQQSMLNAVWKSAVVQAAPR